MKLFNNNNLILPISNKVQFENGFSVSEQRGKRDLVWGLVVEGEHKSSTVLYPMYAADSIQLTLDQNAQTYHIVKTEDIIMSKD
jgi:hypothetical protein